MKNRFFQRSCDAFHVNYQEMEEYILAAEQEEHREIIRELTNQHLSPICGKECHG